MISETRAPLRALTNEVGYFSLGPISTDWAILEFTHSTTDGPQQTEYAVAAGEGEVILPLGVLFEAEFSY